METQDVISQGPIQELKAERVQKEALALGGEPFEMSLKAERVQTPALATVGGTVSLAYEVTVNQMKNVAIELNEPQIVINFFATGGLEAA